MIAKCPNCSALLECNQAPGETVDCAGCGQTFTAQPVTFIDADAIQRKAANIGLDKVAGKMKPKPSVQESHRITSTVWRDDGRWIFLFFVFGVAIPVFLAIVEDLLFAYAFASLAWGAFLIWGFGLLRACAHRLRHIEDLLARRG